MPNLRPMVLLLALIAVPLAGRTGETTMTRPSTSTTMTRPTTATPVAPAGWAPTTPTTSAPMVAPTIVPSQAPQAVPAPRFAPSIAPTRAPDLAPRSMPHAVSLPSASYFAPATRSPSVSSTPRAPAPRTPVAAPAPRVPKIIRFDQPATAPSEPQVAPAQREPLPPRGGLLSYGHESDDVPPPTSPMQRGGWSSGPLPDYMTRPANAANPPPVHYWYLPWYSQWFCHPYWRYTRFTYVVVWFGFDVYPYDPYWWPPDRDGWVWVPGRWEWGRWIPGYWAPVDPPPVHYVYVPGSWYDEATYVEGYYRVGERHGWEWIDGYYADDGTPVQGHWRPTEDGPASYVFEPGLWDGDTWIDGFWRPAYLDGFTWVPSSYDADGVYSAGYWLPTEDRPGHVWIPGWFDGRSWIDGYWVDEEQLDDDTWRPPEGYDAGWDRDDVPTVTPPEGPPLAIPVEE